ncbi:MAG: hypothetical protein K8R88_04075 [Armatimonadetes bacterium]|nr:hypothetical protein [Armatimonadota bacterium]
MNKTLSILLDRVFDYAGLFPPSALTMDEAVKMYFDHRAGSESWITSRFVCPVNWLPDLGAQIAVLPVEHFAEFGPWPLAVLGTSLDGSASDLNQILRFEAEFGQCVSAEAYEVKAGTKLEKGFLKPLAKHTDLEIFLEVAIGEGNEEILATLAEYETLGVKARLGGLESAAFPNCHEVALFIQGCLNLDLEFKCTAGLHHPIRHWDEKLGTKMHGFLNVIMAGALTLQDDLSLTEIEEIIAEEDPTAFVASDDEFGWHSHFIDEDGAEQFRAYFRAIGSCSILEPLDGLRGEGQGAVQVSL